MSVRILVADVLDGLAQLEPNSVQCAVTSPPYWGLRDYGVPGQIGLEPTPDQYVARLVAVFEQVKRVLRHDGVLWLNLGDSYAAARGGTAMPAETLAGGEGGFGARNTHRGRAQDARQGHRDAASFGLKHKDLCGIPWRVAFALQAAGWYLRSDIIWHKPNPMPESVTDRPTKSHEYLFLLAKSARYFYDAEAIAEPALREASGNVERKPASERGVPVESNGGTNGAVAGSVPWEGSTRNRRTVWSITTRPFQGAHFATFPPELPRLCILAGSRPGDTVLDPFCGAGTTGLVADRLGRDFVGIELNPKYAEMARDRIAADAPLLYEGGNA